MGGETFEDAPLKLRIGIHSGPAVAGVIGLSRFAYDLWGDTVNVASRIHHPAKPDEIQLSSATRELLDTKFSCTAAGEIEARGAGRVAVWIANVRMLPPLACPHERRTSGKPW
jgi:adenylate cyclase